MTSPLEDAFSKFLTRCYPENEWTFDTKSYITIVLNHRLIQSPSDYNDVLKTLFFLDENLSEKFIRLPLRIVKKEKLRDKEVRGMLFEQVLAVKRKNKYSVRERRRLNALFQKYMLDYNIFYLNLSPKFLDYLESEGVLLLIQTDIPNSQFGFIYLETLIYKEVFE